MSDRRRPKRLETLQPHKKGLTPAEQRAPMIYKGTQVKRRSPEKRVEHERKHLTRQDLIDIHAGLREQLQTRREQLTAAKQEKRELEAEIRQLRGFPDGDDDSDY